MLRQCEQGALCRVTLGLQKSVDQPCPEEDTWKGVAPMVLNFSEAQRFSIIKKNVTKLWAAGGTVSPLTSRH
jgi:hypothetical protein